MKDPNRGSVCINHPDTPAVAHCCVCRRPVCAACLVEEDGFKCCSDECLQMARESTGRVAGIMERRSADNRRSLFLSMVRLLIAAAVIVLLFFFRAPVKEGYCRYIRPMFKRGGQTIEEINRRNIQRDHERRHQREDMLDALSK